MHPGEEAERCAEVLQVLMLQALALRALVLHGLQVALPGLCWQQALRPHAAARRPLCLPGAAQQREWGVAAVQLLL